MAHRITTTFDQHVVGIAADDFEFMNLDTNQSEPVVYEGYDSATRKATFRFRGVQSGEGTDSGMLPSGNYQLALRPGAVRSAATGEPMETAYNYEFFFLWGDADHNRVVDATDWSILDYGYVTQSKLFPQLSLYENADFDYSSIWDSTDYALLDAGYVHHLFEPLAPFNVQTRPLNEDPDIGIRLWWSDEPAVHEWRIERNDYDGNGYVPITGWFAAGTQSFADSGLRGGQWYGYRVRGRDAQGNLVAYTPHRGAYTVLPAPSDSRATALSDSQILIEWTDRSAHETGFNIYRSTTGYDGWTLAGTTGIDQTSFTDSGLNANRSYWYYVEATGRDINSARTAPVSATTHFTASLAAPSDFHASSPTTNTLNVQWNYPAGTAIAGFRVFEVMSDGTYELVADNIGPNERSRTLTGLKDGWHYELVVRAYDGPGESADSNSAFETTVLPPVESLIADSEQLHDVFVHWTNAAVYAPQQIGFDICMSLDGVEYSYVHTEPDGGTSWRATGLEDGTGYWFRVVAFRGDVYSAPVEAFAYTRLEEPRNLSLDAPNPYEINATWEDRSANEQGYMIGYREKRNSPVPYLWLTTPVNATGFPILGLQPDTEYAVKIRAVTYLEVGGQTQDVVSWETQESEIRTPALPPPPQPTDPPAPDPEPPDPPVFDDQEGTSLYRWTLTGSPQMYTSFTNTGGLTLSASAMLWTNQPISVNDALAAVGGSVTSNAGGDIRTYTYPSSAYRTTIYSQTNAQIGLEDQTGPPAAATMISMTESGRCGASTWWSSRTRETLIRIHSRTRRRSRIRTTRTRPSRTCGSECRTGKARRMPRTTTRSRSSLAAGGTGTAR